MVTIGPYMGYYGEAEYHIEDKVWGGKIKNITDTVTFEADSSLELHDALEAAVDDYIATLIHVGRVAEVRHDR